MDDITLHQSPPLEAIRIQDHGWIPPGMSGPKPAGVRCIQLTSDNRCQLYGKPERPDVCRAFQPSAEICGRTNDEAMHNLIELEALTSS